MGWLRTIVDREVGMKQLDDVLPVIGSVAGVAEQDITAAERCSVLRRFSPRFLKSFEFRSSTPNDPLLAAIELLKAMDRDSTRVCRTGRLRRSCCRNGAS